MKKESELRQATILFADISGFTAMSEKMNPEEVTSVKGFLKRIYIKYSKSIFNQKTRIKLPKKIILALGLRYV